ncbi:Minor histocompatibility antigen H13 [Clydaea vesicula]|uniref:Minor histocompatibility antigen H13 n=1 Tax=Clydaea vesicula TaxID=447962 RepID=A0AAD5XSV6_9FUNG|nr:Minor histocompatibility antigen H13 [Clydaea vesicula]
MSETKVGIEEVTDGIFVAYAALGLMAILPIYFGSYASLKFEKKKKGEEEDEFFSLEDAKWFPIIGSCSLFGLYLVFKFLPKDYIDLVVLGIAGTVPVLLEFSRSVTGLKLIGNYYLSLKGREKDGEEYNVEKFSYHFGYFHLVLLVLSSILGGYYAVTKHWVVSNFYGEVFALNAIQLLNLDSFKTGMMLLGGLFFYDIFWVFGTEVMVTVAKNFEAPIKVVFPKNIFDVLEVGLFSQEEKIKFTMLGLGDIVIPGIFVALCLQYDFYRYKKTLKGKAPSVKNKYNFSTPYFTSNFIAYIAGLFTTVFVMHNFKAAQPALLYLSPACTLTALITALVRGEVKELFTFNPQEKDEKTEGEEKKKLNKNITSEIIVEEVTDLKKRKSPKKKD